MRQTTLLLAVTVALAASELSAQAVPDGAPATRVETAYRRTPNLRVDPFRHVMIPHWGLVFSGGASAGNNVLSAKDVRALVYLDENDEVLVGDLLDAFGLVPIGAGIQGFAQGEGGVHLGGPFGGHLSLGFSAQGRGYGGFQIDDGAVALLRDGNGADSIFSLGESNGSALATAEVGAHAVVRLGPMGSEDGALLSLGFGARYVRSLAYAHGEATINSRVFVTADSIGANVEILSAHTPEIETDRGAGIVGDVLLRFDWPTSGMAAEIMVANIGKVAIAGVERRSRSFDVSSTDLLEVTDSLDASEDVVLGVEQIELTLPRIVRFSASAWANRVLQLDVSATMPVGGEFESSLVLDMWSTWRLVKAIPLRAGIVLGGRQGLGFTGGIGIETRNLLLQIAGGSLGGLFENATGGSLRVELGFFF